MNLESNTNRYHLDSIKTDTLVIRGHFLVILPDRISVK